MASKTIMVVDDDRKITSTMQLYLEHAGFEVRVSHSGSDAFDSVQRKEPDLIILDIMLPKMNGLELCRALRTRSEVPIILLTARTTEEDKLRGLDLGADDYVTKPFSPRELVARVRTVLRRRSSQIRDRGPQRLTFSDLGLDLERHEARVGEELINLTPTEFALLKLFVQSPERVFTRRELVDTALGWDFEGLERTIDAHIMNLRRKIEAKRSGSLIATVYGVGYKLTDENKPG